MRLHPITIALRALRGERSIHGRPLPDAAEAAALLRQLTGQDFGDDAAAWGKWLRANRRAYSSPPSAQDAEPGPAPDGGGV